RAPRPAPASPGIDLSEAALSEAAGGDAGPLGSGVANSPGSSLRASRGWLPSSEGKQPESKSAAPSAHPRLQSNMLGLLRRQRDGARHFLGEGLLVFVPDQMLAVGERPEDEVEPRHDHHAEDRPEQHA